MRRAADQTWCAAGVRVTGDAGSLGDLARSVQTGERSATELVEEALARLAVVEPHLAAFSAVTADRARQEAEQRTTEAAAGGVRGPLHGVPVAVKDLFDVAGDVTTAGSRIPPTGRAATADAEAVRRLRAAGAVVIGRTRTHEYAWGLTTQHDKLGGTRNPWDTSRVPGGSSGGSAAAVAAGVVPLALGTDTAGSIRLPAAWCGLVGHKPTYGKVSLAGVVPLAPTLDHGGALVRTVADARLALSVLTGQPVERRLRDPRGLRVGRAVDRASPACDADVERLLGLTFASAVAGGADVRDVDVPSWERLRGLFVTVQGGEAAAYHRRLGHWPDRAEQYDAGVRSRLAGAARVSQDDLTLAYRRLAELRQQVEALLADVDVLLLPVAGSGPSRVDDPDAVIVGGQPQDLRAQVLPHTLLASLCGLPACSIPVGVDSDGLPVAVQVIGAAGADELVLDVAEQLQTVAQPST
ncbi:MAG: amidase [Actinobacteria bacterium]|nr:amidase [Actinomycetota bacterium]MCA1722262.1 amidase [Actinomycetota bacterium]